MALNLTKMSPNGQIVIPMEVRRLAEIKPAAQFIVVPRGKDLLLRHVSEDEVLHEFEVMETIDRAEADFKAGRYVEVDSSMPFEEMDKVLRSRARS